MTGGRVRRDVWAIVSKVLAHDLPQLSAALTYYTVLSLIPALLVMVSLLGMVGLSADTVHSLLDTLGEAGAPWAAQAVSDVLDSVLTSESSGTVFTVSVILSLWAASGYVGSFMAGSDRIYEIAQPAPVLDRDAAARRARAAAAGPALADRRRGGAGRAGRRPGSPTPPASGRGHCTCGPGSSGPCSWCSGCCCSRCSTSSRRAARQPALWWLLPGAAVGLGLWFAASALFSLYLSNFANYNRVYGTLGAAVAFLVWAWLLNMALLVGVEVNRELEVRRAGGTGVPAAGPAPESGPEAAGGPASV